ncbi:MAG: hypothetical protein ABUS51_03235 [Acidobacteriota bacterium]
MDDLLNTLEIQTAEGLSACAEGQPLPAALIEARQARIAELAELIEKGALVSEEQLVRLRMIEAGGAAMLARIRETGDGLHESLRIAALQKSFAKCVETVLDVSESAEPSLP